MDKCICHIGEFAIKDATARADLEKLQERVTTLETSGGGTVAPPEPTNTNILPSPFEISTSNPNIIFDYTINGVNAGDVVTVRYSIAGGEERTALGNIIEINGIVGMVKAPDDMRGVILEGDEKDNIMLMGYLNTQDGENLGNGSIFALMANGSYDGTAVNITINAIEKDGTGNNGDVTLDYNKLINKPSINGVVLQGNVEIGSDGSNTIYRNVGKLWLKKPSEHTIGVAFYTFVSKETINNIDDLFMALSNLPENIFYPATGAYLVYTDAVMNATTDSKVVVGMSCYTQNGTSYFRLYMLNNASGIIYKDFEKDKCEVQYSNVSEV